MKLNALGLSLLLMMFLAEHAPRMLSSPKLDDVLLTSESITSIREGSAFLQIATLAIVATALARRKSYVQVISSLRRDELIVAYLTFAVLSILYTMEPWLTVRRLTLFFAVVMMGAVIATDSEDRGTTSLLSTLERFGFIYVVVAAIAVLRDALLGFSFITEPWSVYGSSHRDGEVFAITLILGIGRLLGNPYSGNRSARELLWISALFVLLVLTGSRTSILGVGFAVLLMNIRKDRISKTILVMGLFLTLGLLAYAALPATVVQAVVRPETIETLTGRSFLWIYLVSLEGIDPIFGTGFGAFWTSDRIADVEATLGWAAPVSHNGFLDVFLNSGILGLGFHAILLAAAWRRIDSVEPELKKTLIGVLAFVVAQNLTQGSFQNPRMFVEVVFWWILVSLSVARFRKLAPSQPSVLARRNDDISHY